MYSRSRNGMKLFWLAVLVLMVSAVGAQMPEQAHRRTGLPQDWTHRHVIFSRSALHAYPDLAYVEPRALHQWLRQNARPADSTSDATSDAGRDWSVSLGAGHVAAGMFPAKYGFDTTATPSCTNDYVVFALNVAGSATQANVIAFNNLYSGTNGYCGTTGPSVLFAYNISTIGGRIATSPILSLDGTKIGFVETAGSGAVLHILTWKTGLGNGTSATAPAVPGVGNTASMVNISLGTVPITRSSPWIDYNTDTVYVGNNSGRVYKITNAFLGSPALAGAPWPVLISPGRTLTGPVLDNVTKNIFIGDGRGFLLSFNSITPGTPITLAVGQSGATSSSILDSPMVDSTNGVVYAVSGNDGTSAVMVEATTANLTELARARIGLGGLSGATVPLYDGSPDNNYFNSASTGTFLVCGTASGNASPVLYTFGFTGTTLNTIPLSSVPLSSNTGSRCSPITEFFNPNVGTSGTDFFFFGLTASCVGPRGCIMSTQSTGAPPLPVGETGGTSGIVIDNQSPLPQASSIYFGNLGGTGTAVKLTQNGLN